MSSRRKEVEVEGKRDGEKVVVSHLLCSDAEGGRKGDEEKEGGVRRIKAVDGEIDGEKLIVGQFGPAQRGRRHFYPWRSARSSEGG